MYPSREITLNVRAPGQRRSAMVVQLGFAGIVASALLAHAGSILNVAFAPLSIAVAAYLFVQAPTSYFGFCMWLWLMTPFVRRVVDWQTSYNVLSPVMLAPLLASGLTLWTAFRLLPRSANKTFWPFYTILAICFYGLIVGAVQIGPSAAAYACLNWIVPVCVAIHILAHPRRAPDMQRLYSRRCPWERWSPEVMAFGNISNRRLGMSIGWSCRNSKPPDFPFRSRSGCSVR